MMFKKTKQILLLLLSPCLLGTCTEPFEIETEGFESILVVNAILTGEVKQQEILLSRTFSLKAEEARSPEERNATVKVVDDLQNEYIFQETDPGKYVSTVIFSAQPGRSYQLFVTTNDGRSYASEPNSLAPSNPIDNLYAERMINDDDIEGIGVFIDSFDPPGNAIFYRYEFEETYKIEAPAWSPFEASIIDEKPADGGQPIVLAVPKQDLNDRFCYDTKFSKAIITVSTEELTENKIDRFLVRFIRSDDFMLRSRYSILVRQYVQSREEQAFYEVLKDFSDPESLFSQTQPGFIVGNVFSVDNSQENVLGLFEVSTISSQRIFFNFRDFFPIERPPPFVDECQRFTPANTLEPPLGETTLVDALKFGDAIFFSLNGENNTFKPFILVPRICGDCTVLGSNIVPDFWKD